MSSQAYLIVDGVEVEVIRHHQISGTGPIEGGRQAFFATGTRHGRPCPTIGKPCGSVEGTRRIDAESFPLAKSVVVKVWYADSGRGKEVRFVRVK